MSSIGFLCLLFLVPNFAYSTYMKQYYLSKISPSRSISTRNMGKNLTPKREIKPIKNFVMKIEKKAVEKPHIDRDKIPLIIIGVPGMGVHTYEKLVNVVNYIDFIFEKRFFIGNNVFISASPQINKQKINIYNYKDSEDFQFYLRENDIDEEKVNEKIIEEYNNIVYPNSLLPDLGGENCQECFKKTVVKQITDLKADKYRAIFYANSQGTATVLNYLANLVKENKYTEKDNTFKIGGKDIIIEAISLESVFATRRSAILHSAKWFPIRFQPMNYRPIQEIYLHLPYLPQLFFISKGVSSLLNKAPEIANSWRVLQYKADDQEPIKSIRRIPCDVPIFITHTQYDPQTPFSDAKALYYARKSIKGCNNTFFIPIYGRNWHSLLFYKGNLNFSQAPFIKEALNGEDTLHQEYMSEEEYRNKFQPQDLGKQEYESYKSLVNEK